MFNAAARADLGAYWMLVTENLVGFTWLSSLSIWSGPKTDIISCAVGMRLMFPILGAIYPAEPKAAGAAALGDVALIALEPSGLGALRGLGSPEVLRGLGRFGSLSLFIFNPFKDCNIGFAIAPYELCGADAGSIPRLTGLAAVLTACNSAGSFIGATCDAAAALENGALKEYEGVAVAVGVAAIVAAVGDGPLIT